MNQVEQNCLAKMTVYKIILVVAAVMKSEVKYFSHFMIQLHRSIIFLANTDNKIINICFILNTKNDQVNRKAFPHLAIEFMDPYCNVGRPNATKTVHNVHVSLYTLTWVLTKCKPASHASYSS